MVQLREVKIIGERNTGGRKNLVEELPQVKE